MFEEKDYETLMREALEMVSSDVDKREGSLIYDALAPCMYQIAQAYFQLSNFVDLVMLDTAVGEYLDRKADDYGVERKKATKSIRIITTDSTLQIGSRWATNNTTYLITDKIENGYIVECEEVGIIGNENASALTGLDYTPDAEVYLGSVISPGVEEEDDEAFRSRIMSIIGNTTASGNVADYKKWALEVPGVGDARVFPLCNGPGTVKLLVVNSDKSVDNSILDETAEYIESKRPIGATVTVNTPTEKEIDISVSLVLSDDVTNDSVAFSVEKNIRSYLKSLVFTSYTVSYAKIGALILESNGVLDYTQLIVNSGTESIHITDDEIPVLGMLSIN